MSIRAFTSILIHLFWRRIIHIWSGLGLHWSFMADTAALQQDQKTSWFFTFSKWNTFVLLTYITRYGHFFINLCTKFWFYGFFRDPLPVYCDYVGSILDLTFSLISCWKVDDCSVLFIILGAVRVSQAETEWPDSKLGTIHWFIERAVVSVIDVCFRGHT